MTPTRDKDLTALVTGGSRGIGRAISFRLAVECAKAVAVNYVENDAEADRTRKLIEQTGSTCILIKANLSSPAGIDTLFERLSESVGKLDIFIHCAAVTAFKPLNDVRPNQWDLTMNVNARSFLLCSQKCTRLMKNGKIGNFQPGKRQGASTVRRTGSDQGRARIDSPVSGCRVGAFGNSSERGLRWPRLHGLDSKASGGRRADSNHRRADARRAPGHSRGHRGSRDVLAESVGQLDLRPDARCRRGTVYCVSCKTRTPVSPAGRDCSQKRICREDQL